GPGLLPAHEPEVAGRHGLGLVEYDVHLVRPARRAPADRAVPHLGRRGAAAHAEGVAQREPPRQAVAVAAGPAAVGALHRAETERAEHLLREREAVERLAAG